MDLHCGIDLEWCSSDTAGSIVTPAGKVPYSIFCRTEGGDGPSPEVLLLAAISSSYCITLADVLQDASLPQTRISVHADGVIVMDFGEMHLARVRVNPAIWGADDCRRDAYERAAIAARDGCMIGRSIRGNVAYVVGDVSLSESTD